jgi:ribosomal-protein-alanine N-acetyltransferase
MRVVRRGEFADLDAVREIQDLSPEAAHWRVEDYLEQDFRVAVHDGRIAGFLVARRLAPDEAELLNLAVEPEFRRTGVAISLLDALISDYRGTVFLEVRESNSAARKLYKRLGFQEVARRQEYYKEPLETAIVMKFHSC